MLQPIFCVYLDRGLFCQPALRLNNCSYTTLFAAGGQLWMWFEFLIQAMVFLAFLLLTQYDSPVYQFARHMLTQLGYPVDEINFYFLYQAEAEGNVQNAALLETFLATWCLPLLPRYLIAPFQKTQAGMDSWVRMTNFAWLPFTTSDGMRVLAFTAVWVGIFPGTSIMMAIYYPVAIFVARTNLLGRVEPGPPTKPLLYRFCFTLYMPFHMLLHLFLSAGIYADVPLPDPSVNGSGLFPGFQHSPFETPRKATHTSLAILIALLLLLLAPYLQRRQALADGVLTPWEIIKLHCWTGLADTTFAYTARVSVGIHHHTSPSFFRPGAVDVPAPKVVELPVRLPADARFEPISGIDLLSKGGLAPHGSVRKMP